MNNDKEIAKRARIAAEIIATKDASHDLKQKAKAGLALLSISDQIGTS